MAFPYVELAETAAALIAEAGRDVVFRQLAEPTDSDKPWRGPGNDAPADITVKAVVLDYALAAVDGEKIMRGDKRCFVAVNALAGAALEDYDQMVDGSDIYSVVLAAPLKPGTVGLIYEVQLRK